MPILQLFAGRQNSERDHAGVASSPCYMMLGWTLKEEGSFKISQKDLEDQKMLERKPSKGACELSP